MGASPVLPPARLPLPAPPRRGAPPLPPHVLAVGGRLVPDRQAVEQHRRSPPGPRCRALRPPFSGTGPSSTGRSVWPSKTPRRTARTARASRAPEPPRPRGGLHCARARRLEGAPSRAGQAAPHSLPPPQFLRAGRLSGRRLGGTRAAGRPAGPPVRPKRAAALAALRAVHPGGLCRGMPPAPRAEEGPGARAAQSRARTSCRRPAWARAE